jgi:hypothetical protein
MVNFFFARVNRLLVEIRILISVSDHNMRHIEAPGGYDASRVVNDPKLSEAISQALEGVEYAAKMSEELFSALKCDHIDSGAKALRYWSTQTPRRWSELNTRARALRDAIEVELKQYLYYQYPKLEGQKLRSWREDWKASLAAFPDIKSEVFSAIDCYALQYGISLSFDAGGRTRSSGASERAKSEACKKQAFRMGHLARNYQSVGR